MSGVSKLPMPKPTTLAVAPERMAISECGRKHWPCLLVSRVEDATCRLNSPVVTERGPPELPGSAFISKLKLPTTSTTWRLSNCPNVAAKSEGTT